MRALSRPSIPCCLAFAMIAGACSSSANNSWAPKTGASTTTIASAEAAKAYTAPGPYPVGITTLELAGGAKVEVWYPAAPGTTGKDSYDVRKLVPPTVTKLLTASIPAIYTIDAGRDAPVADGTFPLVLFSHGFSGIRQQSSFLTSHIASWGFIVAAPDHWSRDLYHVLDGVLGGKPAKAADSVDDLRHTRTLLTDDNTRPGSRFAGHVDTTRIAAIGHSAGGASALGLASDDGIAGYASLASGALLGGGPNTTTSTAPPPPLPSKPSLFVAGKDDHVASVDKVTLPAFAAAPAPSRLWVLDRVGHNGFDDFCTFGNGKGIIGVAEASGLSGFLDAQPQFRTLGEDGCLKPNAPVAETFPVIDHVVVAWLRELFSVDASPVGLGPEVANAYPVNVEVREKLS